MFTVTYKDIAICAAGFLRLDEAKKALEEDSVANADESVQKEIETLTECINLTLHEIACDYIPLKKTEAFITKDARIYFRNFSKNPIDIYNVRKGGRSIDFKVFHDCILASVEGKLDVTYSYAPVKGDLRTELEWEGQRPGMRIAAYGAACEYCLSNGMTDEAVLWDKRFKDALFKSNSLRSERKVMRRKWL